MRLAFGRALGQDCGLSLIHIYFEGDDGLKNYLSEMLDGASAVASDSIDRAASATTVSYTHLSAQRVIDDYEDNDMPLGWFLPNDGYGAGYGPVS